MGTAGSVKLLEDKLQKTFIVASGDSILSSDLAMVLKAHRASNAAVTMALWEVDNPTEYGIVGLSETEGGVVNGKLSEGYITKFLEKPSPTEAFSNVINAGLYVIEPEVISHIPRGEKFDFSKQLFPQLLELGWPMYAQTIDGVWFDVGQPFELINAQASLMSRYGELPFTYPSNFEENNGVLMADSAVCEGTVDRAVIGPECVVDAGASVSDALLMEGCQIGAGARVIHSVLGVGVIVPSGCDVRHCVVGDGAVLRSGEHYDAEKIEHSP